MWKNLDRLVLPGLELWQPFCSKEQNHLCNFGRVHHEEQFCEIILNLDQWLRRCSLNIFLIWGSGGPFVRQRSHLCNFGRVHHEKQFCDIILNLEQWFRRRCHLNTCRIKTELWRPICSMEHNHLCNFGRVHHEEHFCEIILNSDHLELWQPIYSEQNHLCNYGRVHHEEQFCEIILNLGQWFRICRLKTFLI